MRGWPMGSVCRFWGIAAEEEVKTIINSDAHRPDDVGYGRAELGPMRERLGLEEVDLLEG